MKRRIAGGTVTIAAVFFLAVFFDASPVEPVAAAPRSCESLAALELPQATITSARSISAGAFTPPGSAQPGGAAPDTRVYAKLPAFCRVEATLKPSSDSDIRIEVWLPASGWNGKFQAVGNGGWAGVISYSGLAAGVEGGYASASTDTGHVGNTGAFALGHPEKFVDFGYRAVHEMTVQAKTIVDAYYGTRPKLSFWNGCSQGGRQGITEAMRYPGDYDAIVAGAASVGQATLHGVRIAMNRMVNRTADSYIPPAKYPLLHSAVLEACDAIDGVKDGVLENPTRCRFDPKVLECRGADSTSCLTASQVETARALYAPVTHPTTRKVLLDALLLPGTEARWGTLAGPQPLSNGVHLFKYVVFKDPAWDARQFNSTTDIDLAIKVDNGITGLADPNLRPFFRRGGKLLMYHGWADPQVPAMNRVTYFNKVLAELGREAAGKSIQLYMVPGMAHCRGGEGTDTFDKMAAIEQWVATGKSPEQIAASRIVNGTVARTRPLCPYGKVAKWNGKGSTDDIANFSCVVDEEAGGR